jgi:hypothetical protein
MALHPFQTIAKDSVRAPWIELAGRGPKERLRDYKRNGQTICRINATGNSHPLQPGRTKYWKDVDPADG